MSFKVKNEKRGQRCRTCNIKGCDKKGRVLANLGGIEIAYCPEHRKKYGERIVNALINALFNFKLTNYLADVKAKIFMSPDFFCESCGQKLKDYIIDKTEELEKIIDYAEENDAHVAPEDLK